jgi:two-component system chemotaxis response regulator CheB
MEHDMPNKKTLRVVLAQPAAQTLPEAAEVISADPGIHLIEIGDPPETLWRQVITYSPDITVIFAPVFGERELRSVSHILRGVYSRILLITDESYVHKVPQDAKIEIIRLNKSGGSKKALAESILARILAIGPLKKPGDIKPGSENQPAAVPDSDTRMMKYLIAIGASTGGTEALAQLFRLLPENIPGIVVVQHMPPVFTKMYAERLNKELPFTVAEAGDNELIKPRCIYIAPGDRHLTVKKRGSTYFTVLGGTDKVSGHCPSVDVLFKSVANEAGKRSVGIILTGMGADGAQGLLQMRQKGAYTIGQDEASSVVYGMPKKAYEYGAVIRQAGLADIPKALISHIMNQ